MCITHMMVVLFVKVRECMFVCVLCGCMEISNVHMLFSVNGGDLSIICWRKTL